MTSMGTLSSSSSLLVNLHSKASSPPKTYKFRVSSLRVEENHETSILPEKAFSSRTTLQKLVQLIGKSTPRKEVVKKKKEPSLVATILNAYEDFICTFLDLPLPPSLDPKHVLSGNYAAVDELPPTPCEVVEGALPSCLDGAYLRNGPNPQFIPRGPYHLFDGDGMLHVIKISQGKAVFCSRYVKTHKYIIEHKNGSPVIPSIFSSFNGFCATMARLVPFVVRSLAGQFNPSTHGIGVANTSLALIGGDLFALAESDLPYKLKLTPDGDVITQGRHTFCSKPVMSMTAHPKTDPNTGEAFGFAYNVFHPFLTYFRINREGVKQKDIPINSLTRSSFIHDFAVTKNYVVFPETQIVIDPMNIIRGKSPVGTDLAQVPRLGILPRYAKNDAEMTWIDAPGLNMVHAFNAWEEDDGNRVVILASNAFEFESPSDPMDFLHLSVDRVEINLKQNKVLRQPLCSTNLDLAVINPSYAGKKNRFIYAAVTTTTPKRAGVMKLDLSLFEADNRDCAVGSRLYEPGCFGGEPFFVPRDPGSREDVDEDDGYLVTYLHNEKTGESRFLVMDAKSPELEIVAQVKLPGRVPYGFHGLFVPESELKDM